MSIHYDRILISSNSDTLLNGLFRPWVRRTPAGWAVGLIAALEVARYMVPGPRPAVKLAETSHFFFFF